MTLLATVLYEDTMLPSPGGNYPMHDFVMRLVEDDIDGQTWRLHKLVDKNPRKGIGNVIRDVTRTSLLAGAGHLFLLVDRDRVAEHLNLPGNASEADIVAELHARSDAANKLSPYFLEPNIEGLVRAIQECDPTFLPDSVRRALQKKLNDRNIVFNATKRATRRSLRDCVRKAQPGLVALAVAIAELISRE